MFYHLRPVPRSAPLKVMKKSEKPYMVIDGDDAFPDFLDPKWRKKTLAELEELSAQRPKPEKTRRKANSETETLTSGDC